MMNDGTPEPPATYEPVETPSPSVPEPSMAVPIPEPWQNTLIRAQQAAVAPQLGSQPQVQPQAQPQVQPQVQPQAQPQVQPQGPMQYIPVPVTAAPYPARRESANVRPAGRDSASTEPANAPLARDLISLYQQIEREEKAKEDNIEEYQYIEEVAKHDSGLSKLVSYTASFAVEETISLLSTNIDRLFPVSANVVIGSSNALRYFCSEKLEAHVQEVYANIIQQWPQNYVGIKDVSVFWNSGDIVLTKFARCVADAWRSSSVISARRYSTTKAIDTLQLTLMSNLRYFKYVSYNSESRRLEQTQMPSLPPLPRHMY